MKEPVVQFSRYGVLGPGELPGPGDERIYLVEFECNLSTLLEKILEAGFTDPAKEIAEWLSYRIYAYTISRKYDRGRLALGFSSSQPLWRTFCTY